MQASIEMRRGLIDAALDALMARAESHVPESSLVEIQYRSPKKCETQRKLYCEQNWKRCEHYLAWKHLRWEE